MATKAELEGLVEDQKKVISEIMGKVKDQANQILDLTEAQVSAKDSTELKGLIRNGLLKFLDRPQFRSLPYKQVITQQIHQVTK